MDTDKQAALQRLWRLRVKALDMTMVIDERMSADKLMEKADELERTIHTMQKLCR